jgi:hypothetical protein
LLLRRTGPVRVWQQRPGLLAVSVLDRNLSASFRMCVGFIRPEGLSIKAS